MSRTIKFQYWNADEEVMIDGDSLAFEDYEPLKFLLSQEGMMEWSGLLDRSGKEIYEGDYLLDEHTDEMGIVAYEEAKYIVTFGNVAIDLCEVHDVVEVVGNIYEVVELDGSND